MSPTLHYFNLRGRAEVMKLALEYSGVAYDVAPVDFAAMKSDREHYPFAQCPRCAADFAAPSSIIILGPAWAAIAGTFFPNHKHACL